MNRSNRRQIMTSRYRSNGRLLAAGWLFAIAGIGSAAVTTAQEHVDTPHRHDRQERESPETAQSAPFATDAPLRSGMARIRNGVEANMPEIGRAECGENECSAG